MGALVTVSYREAVDLCVNREADVTALTEALSRCKLRGNDPTDRREVPAGDQIRLATYRESNCLQGVVRIILDRNAGILEKICAYIAAFFVHITLLGIPAYNNEYARQVTQAEERARFPHLQNRLHRANLTLIKMTQEWNMLCGLNRSELMEWKVEPWEKTIKRISDTVAALIDGM